MMRMTIGVVFAAAFTISGAAQDCIAQSGAPAAAFPQPDRPVADIVSPIWHEEKERDDADEPRQLVRLLGIKSGMTVADIGAGSGYYVVRLSPIVGSKGRIRRRSGPKRNSIGTTSSTASDCVHRSLRHQDVSAVAESTASGRRWRNAATAFTKKSRCDDFASKSI